MLCLSKFGSTICSKPPHEDGDIRKRYHEYSENEHGDQMILTTLNVLVESIPKSVTQRDLDSMSIELGQYLWKMISGPAFLCWVSWKTQVSGPKPEQDMRVFPSPFAPNERAHFI